MTLTTTKLPGIRLNPGPLQWRAVSEFDAAFLKKAAYAAIFAVTQREIRARTESE